MGSRENLESPQSPGESGGRKNSLRADSTPVRRTSVQEQSEHQQTTTEMFKDLFSQKKSMLLSRLTSFDSEVNDHFPYQFSRKFIFSNKSKNKKKTIERLKTAR